MNQAYWDSLAPTFDTDVLEIATSDTRGVLPEIAQSLGGASKLALDFGCGTGSATRVIAPHFAKTIGIDFSKALLAKAEAQAHGESIEYRRRDLSAQTRFRQKAHVSFAVNLLIHPNPDTRHMFLQNIVRNTRKGGHVVLVVPAFESVLHVYHVFAQSQLDGGAKRKRALAYAGSLADDEVISVADGIVCVGAQATKHWTLDELNLLLSQAGLQLESTSRIPYGWAEVTDSPQLVEKYTPPWDWAVVAGK